MIEKRFVQWYAADEGVDLDIAEREIVLTYALAILREHGLLNRLAFKGGTAIRKLHLGGTGRFSLDLDFSSTTDLSSDDLALQLLDSIDGKTYQGIAFMVPNSGYWATDDSCGAEVAYRHDWVTMGRFRIEISCRTLPLLPVKLLPLLRERYFDWMEEEPPRVPAMDIHEVVAEKIRAGAQRGRVRDLFDLFQLAGRPYDRALVRRIAVLKCWETRYAFRPDGFLSGLAGGDYDWGDLNRLVRRKSLRPRDEIVRTVNEAYAFLAELTPEETRLASDRYCRERQLYARLVELLRSNSR